MTDTIHSNTWEETPLRDAPQTLETLRCHGFDVFGEMLGQCGYAEFLLLLFKGAPPTRQAVKSFEALALAIAYPGATAPVTQAALAGSVGGSSSAACLMAALAIGGGYHGGSHELIDAMTLWDSCGFDVCAWKAAALGHSQKPSGAFPGSAKFPGWQPQEDSISPPVKALLAAGMATHVGPRIAWLQSAAGEELLTLPGAGALNIVGAAAPYLLDLGFSADEAEMLWLWLRLPGIAKHILEYRKFGFRRFPTYALGA